MDLNGQFYFVKDNQPVGPFTLDELLEKDISNKTYIWTKGMVNWEKIESIPVILERISNNKNQPPVFIEPKSEGNNITQKGKGVNKTILFLFLLVIVLILGIIGGIYFKDDFLKLSEKVKVAENQIKDIDGNIYGITPIGNQYWTTKNLNVSRFQNGDEIPFVKSDKEWERAGEMGEPACCCYDNLDFNCEKYGRLYNWFAVVDERGIAPNGFHVPSGKEWSSLDEYLGTEAGRILKSEDDWDGKNEMSFNVLAGGYRSSDGSFGSIRDYAFFWSATENDDTTAGTRYLYIDNGNVYRGNYIYNDNKTFGASVRCLRH